MAAVRFSARKSVRVGPLVLRFTESGYQGWSVRVGRWTWNPRTGRHSLNTPGPGGLTWHFGRRHR